MLLKEGVKAPDFALPNQDGREIRLSQYKGKWVLIYFYPKDNTPGCTKEGCTIQENISAFGKNGIIVVGISADSVANHKRFSEKNSFSFDLLSDSGKGVLKSYGVWQKKKMAGKEYMGILRSSFLIDPSGNIAKVYAKVKPAEHALEVLETHKSIS